MDDRADLRRRVERAIEDLVEFGADALSIELLLASLEAWDVDRPD